MDEWAKMPSRRIGGEKNLLQDLKWGGSNNGDVVAALLLYIVLVQHANAKPTYERPKLGWTYLTYEEMCRIASLSKPKVAAGLAILEELGLIVRHRAGRRLFCEIKEYGVTPWAKLPARAIYDAQLRLIPAFRHFTLRAKHELHSLKLYFLIAARRDNSSNYAFLSYEKLEALSAIKGADIKRALLFLSFPCDLILIDRIASKKNPGQICNAYRLQGLEPRRHLGTTNSHLEFALPS